MSRTTHTYSKVNIVIVDGDVYAEDFSVEPDKVAQELANPRVLPFIDGAHFRRFVEYEGKHAMAYFTEWLQEMGAVVDKCWILGPELSDEERGGRPNKPLPSKPGRI